MSTATDVGLALAPRRTASAPTTPALGHGLYCTSRAAGSLSLFTTHSSLLTTQERSY